MQAIDLYESLEKDFISLEMNDVWAKFMKEVEGYLSDNFKNRSMGVVCDFAKEINKVYSAVFPTKEVMERIINDGVKDALLFVHHPSIWDIRNVQSVFYQMEGSLLERFKENRIAIYNLHVPLDNFSEYSTSKTLGEALGIDIEKPFGSYGGALSGIIGKTECKTVEELNDKFSKVVGHNTKLYLYGDQEIKDGRIAIVAGGGNDKKFVSEMIENDVRVLITGISAKNARYMEIHQFEEENKINVLGGTHYSTERFACERMCDYFKKLGLSVVFIEGEPILEDM